jgi:hypothetical protein
MKVLFASEYHLLLALARFTRPPITNTALSQSVGG